MKRLIRLAGITLTTVAAIAFGLSSASAGPTGTAPPTAPTVAGPALTPAFHSDPQTLRPAKSETLFYPVTPCRIADTRHGGGVLTDNIPRTFYVTGTTGFDTQGGTNGGCGIPDAATGITTNITTAGTLADGYLTGYPTGTTPPVTNFISTHRSFNLTANPTFALDADNDKPLTVTDHAGSTHVIIDVTGYYIPQIAGLISGSGFPYSSTSRILYSFREAPGDFVVSVDGDVSECTPVVTPYAANEYVHVQLVRSNQITVYLSTLDIHGQQVHEDGSGYFYLTVTC